MHALFTRKNRLSRLYGRKFCKVILPREMIYYKFVLINAAANRIARTDRRLPNDLAILFARCLFRGSVRLVVLFSKQNSSSSA